MLSESDNYIAARNRHWKETVRFINCNKNIFYHFMTNSMDQGPSLEAHGS